MKVGILQLAFGLSCLDLVTAAPNIHAKHLELEERASSTAGATPTIAGRGDDSSHGLDSEDLQWLKDIGVEAVTKYIPGNGKITIGDAHPYVLQFTNSASVPLTLIVFDDNQQFLSKDLPAMAVTIEPKFKLTISVAEGIPRSGFVPIYRGYTRLTSPGKTPKTEPVIAPGSGQAAQVLGEFTTAGEHSTIDTSYMVYPDGDPFTVTVGGCVSKPGQCSYVCSRVAPGENYCWDGDPNKDTGKYMIVSGPGCDTGTAAQKDGGCKGWKKGVPVLVDFPGPKGVPLTP